MDADNDEAIFQHILELADWFRAHDRQEMGDDLEAKARELHGSPRPIIGIRSK